MISNLDIQRRNTKIDNDKEHIKRVLERVRELSKYDSKVLKSKKFSCFMEKILRAYAEGRECISLPLFQPKNFPYLVVSKFNSYDLESVLIYDWKNNKVFFKQRFFLS